MSLKLKEKITQILIIFSAFGLTFLLTNNLIFDFNVQLNSVFASGLVGLIFAIAFKKYSTLAYCASFAGMSSIKVFPNPFLTIIVGSLIMLIIWELAQERMKGIGGKLGTIAILAMLSVLPFELFLQSDTEFKLFKDLGISTSKSLLLIAASVIGTVGTKLLRIKLQKILK